jgi:4-hydroxy-3-polyprenylbenzoate decarboxylase
MVIEGIVRLDQSAPEGPFGEMFGYMGPFKEENYVIEITSITHRQDPWLMNAFTGMQRGMVTAPMDALYAVSLSKSIPGFVEYTNFQDMMGVIVVSINKSEAGEGMKAGMAIARRNPIAKVVIVVDSDINILDKSQVLFAVGSRWQPFPASEVIEDTWGLQTDPSQPKPGRTSKIVIDATRQFAAEGGREVFPETNRALLEEGAPGVMAKVEQQLGDILNKWREV